MPTGNGGLPLWVQLLYAEAVDGVELCLSSRATTWKAAWSSAWGRLDGTPGLWNYGISGQSEALEHSPSLPARNPAFEGTEWRALESRIAFRALLCGWHPHRAMRR